MPSFPTETALGAFAQGEVPPPLEITYLDFDGNPVDISSYNLHMNIEEDLGGVDPYGTGVNAFVDTGADGKVTYTWVRADMADVGEFKAQGWAENGTNYYASDLYLYSVYDGPGEPPT